LCKCKAAGVQGKRRDEFAAGTYWAGRAERPLYSKWCKKSSLYHTKKTNQTFKYFNRDFYSERPERLN
jgi:hypothetical protein